MLKLQTLWNHNTKNERMSSKTRANKLGMSTFSTLLQQPGNNQQYIE